MTSPHSIPGASGGTRASRKSRLHAGVLPVLCAVCVIFYSIPTGAQHIGMTLAVFPIDAPNLSAGRVATSELREQVTKSHRFHIVEEERVADVLRRIAISHQRDYDEALEAGRLLAARYVCYGSLVSWMAEKRLEHHTRLMAYVRLSVRVVEVERGKVIFDENTTEMELGWKNDAPSEALYATATVSAVKELMRRFENTFQLEGTVIQIDNGRALVDLGLDHGMRRGMKLDVVRPGEVVVHPVTQVPIESPEVRVGEIELQDVGTKSSWAKRGGKIRLGDHVRTRMRNRSSWEW